MDKPIELVALVCLRCSTPVPAALNEVAWVCAQCGQGLALDESAGLAPLEVSYLEGIPPNTQGRPFWVVNGQVSMKRATFGSSGKDRKAAEQFWSQPHRFFIPAYPAPLEELLSAAATYLLKPPNLQTGPAASFQPVTLSAADIKPAAEFIVMAVEAGRKDKLKSLDFDIQLSEPELWILP